MAAGAAGQRGLLIGGADRAAGTGRTEQDLNPYTGEVFATVAAAAPEDVTAAVDAAAAAFPGWAATDVGTRRKIFLRAADLLEQRTEDAVALMAGEVGGTRPWAMFNAGLAADVLREAAAAITAPRGEVLSSSSPGEWGFALRQPAGVVAALAPWNAPLILGVRSFAVALAVGNTAVLKPSEDAPLTAGLFLAEIMREAGLPDGVLNVLTNARDDAAQVVETLIADRRVRRVNFTGSTNVGRSVGIKAAENLKPALLELGGKNSILVLDDADLDYAVDAVTFGAFMNAGQICMSADRVLLPRALEQEFSRRFAAKVAELPCGDPGKPDTVIGPVIGERSAQRVAALVDDAVAQGAVLHTGGGRPDGAVYRPTVLSGVTPEQRIHSEEIFGPVTTVHGYDDVDSAIEVMNDTPYGLTAGVITEDTRRGWAIAQRVRTGIFHINDQSVGDEPQAPFGGVKDSGYGRFGGRDGIDAFTDTRWVTFREQHAQYPF
ncbi:aldehyde dehydrogenase family protein [Saccharopolyspora sp. HNM0986]|uniref:aldehyde dehydrogenase family protein n=1 Tax=Saccharopolyspora galaxeae TaxID=2781241 RepID=UPI00190B1A4F|nr:aldehyde dehydrogenase family protein [Saccharopolyspora sp. HNM0986]MBK0868122.1 aldehyde dehydrogenase family protein [Saccharopolyspora sp. HNM0986]